MSPAEQLKAKLKTMPGFQRVSRESTLPNYITYAVTQGSNILTIGSGEDKRLKTLMGNAGSHNKAPLIGLCYRIYSEPIEFYICSYTPSAGKGKPKEEAELHSLFGETNLEGRRGYREAMRFLRQKLNIGEAGPEAILLDLMEVHGDVLNHARKAASTAPLIQKLFKGYWRPSRNAA